METVEDQNRDFIRDRESRPEPITGSPLINPHFSDDLIRLDKHFKVESVAGYQTIFIIAGETIVAETLDRFACGLLRDEIDRRGAEHPFKRALIVSAKTWRHSHWFTERCPAISVGSGAANDVSQEWSEDANAQGIQPYPLGKGTGLFVNRQPARVVLAGKHAEDSKNAVETYISHPRGLTELLASSWT